MATALSRTKEEAVRDNYPIQTFVLCAGISGADVITSFPAPFDGEVIGINVIVSAAVTTGSKAATLTAYINGVAVAGTALATTSANMTPMGKVLSSTATAGSRTNMFAAGDSLSVTASGVTTYIEGSCSIMLIIRRI